MPQTIYLHKDNPQERGIKQAVALLEKGQIMLYSTGYSYALAALLGCKPAAQRLYQLRDQENDYSMTVVCRDIAHISAFAAIPNEVHKLMRARLGDPLSYVLPVSKRSARQFNFPSKKHEQGFSLPASKVVTSLLARLEMPLLSVSLGSPYSDCMEWYLLEQMLEKQVDFFVDSAETPVGEYTVLNCVDGIALINAGLAEYS